MLCIKTPAKVNLFLNIQGQRPDGFHELAMVMQTLSLFDELLIEPASGQRGISLEYTPNALGKRLAQEAPESNLIVKAYHLFNAYLQRHHTKYPTLDLKVTLNKQIPVQAGLGGGSSDAAAMLLALNHLNYNPLTIEALRILAAELGSDVPFFLTGGMALVSGRGETVEPLDLALNEREWIYSWVVIKPKTFGISTAQAYQAVRQAARYHTASPEYMLLAMRKLAKATRNKPHETGQRLKEFENYLLNDFEPVLFAHYPQLEDIAARLKELGANRPLLSGSGPSMTAILPMTHTHQKLVARTFPDSQYDVFWTYPHPGGPIQADPIRAFGSLAI
ncbi:MAG: 4-(cytidine 5'-diphospho)-2-C-methyl-D-erythritol kinase [Vampirovibrionales bacterium]|nr:4-(cytidine 5'-diphospho)-2-C-methyl-D-erythritol kinase [Vampirovibrionales bacterium]